MRHTSFKHMDCPIARSLERVGEWWSILILRDALHGLTRFDEFQKSLGIAPNMLTRRLNALVESGLLERRRYSEHPERFEYVLTEKGRDLQPVMLALLAWGDRYTAEQGPPLETVHGDHAFHMVPVCSECGEPVDTHNIHNRPGPGADEEQRRRAWPAR